MLSGRNDLTYKVYLKAGLNHTHVLSRISVNRLNFRALLFAVEISEELITGGLGSLFLLTRLSCSLGDLGNVGDNCS